LSPSPLKAIDPEMLRDLSHLFDCSVEKLFEEGSFDRSKEELQRDRFSQPLGYLKADVPNAVAGVFREDRPMPSAVDLR
jgi:hypothetical protein